MRSPKIISQKRRDKILNISISTLGNMEDKVLHIVEYGVMAPSTHNTQPWRFKIKDNLLEIYIDFTKFIPEADPMMRNMYISIGALITNIIMASKSFSVKPRVEFVKNLPGSEKVCSITLENINQAADPNDKTVLNSIMHRQNYRGFYKKALGTNILDQVRRASNKNKKVVTMLIRDPKQIRMLGTLTSEGLQLAYVRPEFRREISNLINHNFSLKKHGLHGYSLRMNFPASLIIPKIMRKKDIGRRLAVLNFNSFVSSPALVVLSTSSDSEKAWIDTGMAMEEIMINLTAQGVTTSIYSAAIEMGNLRYKVVDFLSLGDNKPQVMFCVGESVNTMPYSLRKEPSELIIKSK